MCIRDSSGRVPIFTWPGRPFKLIVATEHIVLHCCKSEWLGKARVRADQLTLKLITKHFR